MPVQLNDSGITRFLAGLESAVQTGTDRAAGFIADLAQQLAPVDEGDFRDSIGVDPATSEPGVARVISDGDTAPHNIYVEFGDPQNPNYPAQPTLAPAADAIDVGQEIAAELRELARRSGV